MCLILKAPPVSDTMAGKSFTMRWTTLKSESLYPGLAGGWCSFWRPLSLVSHAKVNSCTLSPSHILFHETFAAYASCDLVTSEKRLLVWAVFLAAFSHVYGWSLTLRCRLLAKTYLLILFKGLLHWLPTSTTIRWYLLVLMRCSFFPTLGTGGHTMITMTQLNAKGWWHPTMLRTRGSLKIQW